MEKIKLFFKETIQSEKGKDITIVIIVILVGLGSFELGRLSKENDSGGLKILSSTQTDDYSDQNSSKTANVASAVNSIDSGRPTSDTQKNFFASSKGKKYYTISCSAGKTIKQENRIYFTTGEEAERAGYTLSSSCN